jgi:hypothetical protein
MFGPCVEQQTLRADPLHDGASVSSTCAFAAVLGYKPGNSRSNRATMESACMGAVMNVVHAVPDIVKQRSSDDGAPIIAGGVDEILLSPHVPSAVGVCKAVSDFVVVFPQLFSGNAMFSARPS